MEGVGGGDATLDKGRLAMSKLTLDAHDGGRAQQCGGGGGGSSISNSISTSNATNLFWSSAAVSEGSDRDDRQYASTSSSRVPPPSSSSFSSSSSSSSSSPLLRVAESLYAQKRVDECLRVLVSADSLLGSHPDGLFLKALCCLEVPGQGGASLGLLQRALSVDPGHVRSLTTLAEVKKGMGEFEVALETIERAYRAVRIGQGCDEDTAGTVRSAYAGILVEAGTAEKVAGGDSWERKYVKALEVCPEYAPALYNMGVAAFEAGDVRGALELYRRAVEVHPGYVEALCNMGVVLQHEGRVEEAMEAYEKAYVFASAVQAGGGAGGRGSAAGDVGGDVVVASLDGGGDGLVDMVAKHLALALNVHGTHVKVHERDVDRAVRLYERAVALSPGCVEALYNLGVVYAELGEVDKAIFAYRSTIKEGPGCAAAHNNLGVLYRGKGLMGLALQCYERAIRAQPDFPQALNNLAVMYTQQGRAPEALDMLRAAIVADPGFAEAWNNLGVLQRDVGEAKEALESYMKCVELASTADDGEGGSGGGFRRDLVGHRNAGQNLLLGLNYIYDGNEAVICDAHMAWGRAFQEAHEHEVMEAVPVRRRLGKGDGDGENENENENENERIRVGYVSPDLFVHSVSYFAEAPITSHDASAFEVTVYSVSVSPDDKTARLRREVQAAGGHWKDVTELTERQLAELVREDEIDILIDLTGHTANNRLGTFAMRPAPVQVTWIGYPNTTGLNAVDYRITDALCDPLATTQAFSEQLIRLNKCFLCYTPCPEAPEVAPLPADANGYITFGSFNALAKQTPAVLETWAEILKAVPSARLVLKNKPFASDLIKQKFWLEFERLGVHRSRVDLLPLAPKTESHLQQYAMLDVCLDPFPYAGTTTTMEALYMGVPCLTMRGNGHAHNVGVSLVTNVGLRCDDWIAEDRRDYVAKAVKASEDVAGLRRLRRGLRQRVNESSICDVRAFMRDYEGRLKDMLLLVK